MSDGNHLKFELQPKRKGTRTEIWTVTDQEEYRLGEVRWYAPWRRYTFQPDAETLYDAKCLQRISDFCAEETFKRKRARALERRQDSCSCKNGWVSADLPCSGCGATAYHPCKKPCPECTVVKE